MQFVGELIMSAPKRLLLLQLKSLCAHTCPCIAQHMCNTVCISCKSTAALAGPEQCSLATCVAEAGRNLPLGAGAGCLTGLLTVYLPHREICTRGVRCLSWHVGICQAGTQTETTNLTCRKFRASSRVGAWRRSKAVMQQHKPQQAQGAMCLLSLCRGQCTRLTRQRLSSGAIKGRAADAVLWL